MTTLKELEIWRDDPKNWVGSNSSESVNCTFLLDNLLDNLFHPIDPVSYTHLTLPTIRSV